MTTSTHAVRAPVLDSSVFGDWYNTTVMSKVRFYDDNTRRLWMPQTGGSNIPALNDLMREFGVTFTDNVLNGDFTIAGGSSVYYASGTSIAQFPKVRRSHISTSLVTAAR